VGIIAWPDWDWPSLPSSVTFTTTPPITGANLPDRTLVLTYDDGPGPNTLPVAQYLSGMGIAATFFMVGERAERQLEILAQVRALGHRLGNHTWSHPHLIDEVKSGRDVADGVRRTAAVLGAIPRPIAFRAPWGEWNLEVANALAPIADEHVGHIHWRIDCTDWAAWRDGVDPTVVATWYRVHARTMKKGIVLLHDYTADDPVIAAANRSAELTRALVPMLIADGFTFAPLDAVIAALPLPA